MRGETVALAMKVQLVTEECCHCGAVFGLTDYFRKERLRDHQIFYCPNGHGQSYNGETEAQKNARLLRAEEQRHRETLARCNEANAEKERLERKLKRVHRGVCPECNRTFSNLARHIACKHSQNEIRAA